MGISFNWKCCGIVGIGVEDLISIGTIGLIKAINTFNPTKNIKLATYASRCIIYRMAQQIFLHLRLNIPVNNVLVGT